MKKFLQQAAASQGFAAVGVAAARPVAHLEAFERARRAGYFGEMAWLARDPEARCDPRSLLPGARSVICCALPYGERGIEGGPGASPAIDPRRARFARGAEYHVEVGRRLGLLWETLRARAPQARARLCVDTSPLLEKALAERAGLGWIGKHTLLVNEKLGSWFVLGEIVTDLDLEPDGPAEDRCGDCRACLGACPTGALLSPRELDARRCISSLTIEGRGDPPPEFRRWILPGAYGCDICQEVCPYNSARRAENASRGFASDRRVRHLQLEEPCNHVTRNS